MSKPICTCRFFDSNFCVVHNYKKGFMTDRVHWRTFSELTGNHDRWYAQWKYEELEKENELHERLYQQEQAWRVELEAKLAEYDKEFERAFYGRETPSSLLEKIRKAENFTISAEAKLAEAEKLNLKLENVLERYHKGEIGQKLKVAVEALENFEKSMLMEGKDHWAKCTRDVLARIKLDEQTETGGK